MDDSTLWPTDAGEYELLGLIGHVEVIIPSYAIGCVCKSVQREV